MVVYDVVVLVVVMVVLILFIRVNESCKLYFITLLLIIAALLDVRF